MNDCSSIPYSIPQTAARSSTSILRIDGQEGRQGEEHHVSIRHFMEQLQCRHLRVILVPRRGSMRLRTRRVPHVRETNRTVVESRQLVIIVAHIQVPKRSSLLLHLRRAVASSTHQNCVIHGMRGGTMHIVRSEEPRLVVIHSKPFKPLHSPRSAFGFDLDDFCSDVHPEPLRLFARYFVYLYADLTLSLLESNPSAPFSRQCSLSLPFSFHPPPLRFESF